MAGRKELHDSGLLPYGDDGSSAEFMILASIFRAMLVASKR